MCIRDRKWIKKRNDFVSRYLAISEDDPDMDRDYKNLILPSRMHKKHKLINTGRGTASVNPMMKYPACKISVDRRSSRAASIRSMKGKFKVCLLYTSRCV